MDFDKIWTKFFKKVLHRLMRRTFSFKTLIFYYAISKRQNIQKWKFFGSAKKFLVSVSADLVTFTEEILNGKLHFLRSVAWRKDLKDLLFEYLMQFFSIVTDKGRKKFAPTLKMESAFLFFIKANTKLISFSQYALSSWSCHAASGSSYDDILG